MAPLDGFVIHRLLSVPRHRPDERRPDPAPAQLFAALVAAHAELAAARDPALLVAWHRAAPGQEVRVLVGGRPAFPPAETGSVLYPPGAVGMPVDITEAAVALTDLHAWVRCPGGFDPLWTPQERRGDAPRRGGFDEYVTHLREPFAWLVIAEPVPATVLDEELRVLEARIPRLRQRENSEGDRIELERAEGRYRELSRAHATGMWSTHVLVGGATPRSAARAAALLCGSSDLDQLPYQLVPGTVADGLAAAWSARVSGGVRSPFQAPAELLAALARPPRREIPGIRLVERATFDLTPEQHGDIVVGDVLDDSDTPTGRFAVTMATLNRHTFVAGATGAGKSQTVRHLLEELHHAGIPWLVIEPAKAEYALMAGRIGAEHVAVLRPGALDAPPVGLNPLEPEAGFPIQVHMDLVRALFVAAFEASEPFPQVLSGALTRCYADAGWDAAVNDTRFPGIIPTYPSLADLHRTALAVVDDIGYGKEVAANVRGFIDVRLGSLRLGTTGRFFEGCHPMDVGELLRRNVVLEIEDVGNDHDRAFFIGAVLIRVYERLRMGHGSGGTLRHVTVLEEAHRLLKRTEQGSVVGHSVELFTSMLAEVRAYGEGILVAEQIPAKIVSDVVKNTALKIVHRLPAADDRETVGATMNLTNEQSEHIVALPPGRAVVFADGMDHPMRVTVPLGEEREAGTTGTAAVPTARTWSSACGPLCVARHCNLREVNQGVRLAQDARLTLWIELLTAAHLVGRPAPRPDPAWLAGLLSCAERRTLECAIAHRAQAAIDARYTGLVPYYPPAELASHLARSAAQTLDGAAACDGTEVRWQAGAYRWIDVLQALRQPGDPDPSGPHPGTASWARRGLRLSGRTLTEQLDELGRHPDMWRPPPFVVIGTGSPAAYARAVDELSPLPEPAARFLDASRFLTFDTTWPLAVLGLNGKSTS